MKLLSRTSTAGPGRAPESADDRLTEWRRRLSESKLRSRLRAQPRLQGRILAPAGTFRRLPRTTGLYFPFYHEVAPEYGGDLRKHLLAFRRLGPLISMDEAIAVLEGRREITGPVFCLSFDDGHPTWRDVVLPILQDLAVPATFFVATGLIGREGQLGWDGCAELAAAGCTIGSHSVTHRPLAELDDAAAVAEIRTSKAELEARLGVEVRDFAAPYGRPGLDFLDRDVRLVREAGYRSFSTTLRAPMRSGDSPMWIQRQGLHAAWPIWAVRTRIHD